MNEYPWATPETIGDLTISQVVALTNEKPPGGPPPIKSAEDFHKALQKVEADERAAAAAWIEKTGD